MRLEIDADGELLDSLILQILGSDLEGLESNPEYQDTEILHHMRAVIAFYKPPD